MINSTSIWLRSGNLGDYLYRKSFVVLNKVALPTPSLLPASLTNPLATNLLIISLELIPLIVSTSWTVIGSLYAIIASVSKAAYESPLVLGFSINFW